MDVDIGEGPARRAIRLLGAKRIAARCDLTTDAIWKWERQSHGLIPARHQSAVLQLAEDMGVEFTAADVIGARAA